jgi:hypothetical protein
LEVLEGRTVPSLTVLVTAGTPQSAVVNTAFATPLKVLVEDSGNPVGAGVNVTFASVDQDLRDPGGWFPGQVQSVTVATDASGTATAPTFTANFHSSSPYPFIVTASVANGTPASFNLTSLPGPPAGIGPLPYTTPQAATVDTPYGPPLVGTTTPLQVGVGDAHQNPVGVGINVTFTAPGSGASGTFPGGAISVTVATDANSTATAPTFTANGTAGSYELTASVVGASTPAIFNLQNVSHDAVIDGPSYGAQSFLSPAGGVGSVAYSENPQTGGGEARLPTSPPLPSTATALAIS